MELFDEYLYLDDDDRKWYRSRIIAVSDTHVEFQSIDLEDDFYGLTWEELKIELSNKKRFRPHKLKSWNG